MELKNAGLGSLPGTAAEVRTLTCTKTECLLVRINLCITKLVSCW